MTKKPLPPQTDGQTDRWVDRQTSCLPACLSDVTSDRPGLAIDDRLQKQRGRKREKERKRGERIPPLELWEAAGLERAEGRKGSGDGLLFELCVLRFQSQHTVIQAIYILAI